MTYPEELQLRSFVRSLTDKTSETWEAVTDPRKGEMVVRVKGSGHQASGANERLRMPPDTTLDEARRLVIERLAEAQAPGGG